MLVKWLDNIQSLKERAKENEVVGRNGSHNINLPLYFHAIHSIGVDRL